MKLTYCKLYSICMATKSDKGPKSVNSSVSITPPYLVVVLPEIPVSALPIPDSPCSSAPRDSCITPAYT